ncbi:2-hydroxyacid dehydrogenase [Fulvitalea axinellae]|uniref:2-hydroxyacid dehydrogenase n=1 Tax=Fulvitalea axinellae TaxID=1182444 RepID=A0AAU9CTD0_9BACT|nr:2-hydroxyacid dehydrogenase [Fulvitalea axinellae]
MKIVFLDASSVGKVDTFQLLEDLGDFTAYELTAPEDTVARLQGVDVAITNKVVLDAEVISQCPDLKLICISATGMNNVDLDFAKSKGIPVKNVAGYSTESVAQATFAMLLSLANHIRSYDDYVKSGDYTSSPLFTHHAGTIYELNGKRFGIIGLGAIGRRVAKLAEAFGAEVVYYSTSGKNNNQEYASLSLDELLETSDVVSIHAPLNENTDKLIGAQALGKMRNSAILLNAGRGGIVDEEALAEAIDNGKIAGAGIDVFEREPMLAENPLLKVENKDRLVLAPHVAWASREARNKLVSLVSENIKSFISEK